MRISIVIFLLVLSANIFSQEVPNHTWKIVVKDSLTADQNYALLEKTLVANDFRIEREGREQKTVRSAIKQVDNSGSTYFLKFTINQGVIEVSGEWNANTVLYLNGIKTKSTFAQIENRGGRIGEVFEKMKDLALKLGGSQFYIFD